MSGATSIDLLRMLVFAVDNLRRACMVGSPAPDVRKVLEYMEGSPRVGDVVMEVSTVWRREYDDSRIGFFVEEFSEASPDGDRWTRLAENERYGDQAGNLSVRQVVVVHTLFDGRDVFWNNAHFVRVPEGLVKHSIGDELEVAAGEDGIFRGLREDLIHVGAGGQSEV